MANSPELKSYLSIGDTKIEYHQAPTAILLDQAIGGQEHDDKFNYFCGAGVLRALLNQPMNRRVEPHIEAVNWAMRLLERLKGNNQSDVTPSHQVVTYIESLPLVSGLIDTSSIRSTKANDPKQTAEIIDIYAGEGDPKLMIVLGHGGIESGLDTYPLLSGANNAIYPVRFSRYKMGDALPYLSNREQNLLRGSAVDRSVVVYDEDRTSQGDTIRWATEYFRNVLGATVTGITPVITFPSHVEYSPAVLHKALHEL